MPQILGELVERSREARHSDLIAREAPRAPVGHAALCPASGAAHGRPDPVAWMLRISPRLRGVAHRSAHASRARNGRSAGSVGATAPPSTNGVCTRRIDVTISGIKRDTSNAPPLVLGSLRNGAWPAVGGALPREFARSF